MTAASAVPVILVIAVIAVGVAIIAAGRWRVGGAVLASAAALGAVARLVLPASLVGVLAVRSRWVDAAVFVVIAAVLAGMALITVTPHA